MMTAPNIPAFYKKKNQFSIEAQISAVSAEGRGR